MFREAEKLLRDGRVDQALTALRQRMKRLSNSLEIRDLIYGFPEADALCRRIGERIAQQNGRAFDSTIHAGPAEAGVDVYLVSTIYETGGHTALIGDLVRAGRGRRAHLLRTHTNGNPDDVTERALRRTNIPPENAEACREESLLKKLQWLISRLDALQPARVFLLHHPDDVVAAAAILPRESTGYFFIHHVDDRPSLGVHAEGVVHFDLTPFRYHHCRTSVGVEKNEFLPLSCPDRTRRDAPKPKQRNKLVTTATSGAARKFSMQYRPGYGETVACILATTRGRHVHLGPLADTILDHVHDCLARAGIDRDAFQQFDLVDSIWDEMSRWQVDLYLSSFPVPGARASVEVMGSGTPVTWHVRSEATRYADTHMGYPEASSWQDLAELRQLLSQIGSDWHAAQSRAARDQYERLHAPQHWELIFSAAEPRSTFSAPDFAGYQACHQSERFRQTWEAHAILRETLGQPNPMQRIRPNRKLKALLRRLFQIAR